MPLLFSGDTYTVIEKDTPLTYASRMTPYPEVIDILMRAGCSVHHLNSQGFHKALGYDNPEVLTRILAYSPDINALKELEGKKTRSALHYYAVYNDNTAKHLNLILQHNPDINNKNHDGETPLITAVKNWNVNRARDFVKAGADINICFLEGKNSSIPRHRDKGICLCWRVAGCRRPCFYHKKQSGFSAG